MKTNGSGRGISAASIWRMLNRRKLFLLLPVLILVPGVTYYAARLPLKYRAKALVGAEALIPGQPGLVSRVDPGTQAAQEQLRAIRETLLNSPVLAAVSTDFKLAEPRTGGAKSDLMEELKSRIQIQLEGADAFYLGFEARDPKQAMDVTNRLAGLFVERTAAMRSRRVQHQENVLDSEVARMQNELAAREESLKSYKEKVSQDLPERLTTNLKEMENLQQQIQAKTDQITEVEARKASIIEEMDALERQGVLKEEPAPKMPVQIALDDARFKLSQLRTKYTPEHPEIKRLQKEIADLEAATQKLPAAPATPSQPSAAQMRYFALAAELKPIDPRVRNYRRERDSLAAQMQKLDHRINSTPGYETTVAERTREAAMLRARYEALFAKQQEERLNQKAETTETTDLTFKVLEAATMPTAPYSPHPDRVILFGILASLALGAAGVFAAERLDTSFETSEDVESFTRIPVLSTVPSIAAKLSRKARQQSAPNVKPQERQFFQRHRLTVLSDPQSIASQQYAGLAVRVQQKLERAAGKTLVVTSAMGQEGKSVTALNLALALAANVEGRVLLVDCDLRLPRVGERLGLNAEKGFGDLLLDEGDDFNRYVSRAGNLDVIGGGAKPANPLALLASQRARDAIANLRKKYQVIVFDSPPLIPIADSHVLAGLADGVLLVARARKTRQELFQKVVESLEGANVIGIVLNDVEFAATSYAYAYRYYQRHYLG
jgi:polysaccharide chain length determinant protein (PEP-CTERM system associated)